MQEQMALHTGKSTHYSSLSASAWHSIIFVNKSLTVKLSAKQQKQFHWSHVHFRLVFLYYAINNLDTV